MPGSGISSLVRQIPGVSHFGSPASQNVSFKSTLFDDISTSIRLKVPSNLNFKVKLRHGYKNTLGCYFRIFTPIVHCLCVTGSTLQYHSLTPSNFKTLPPVNITMPSYQPASGMLANVPKYVSPSKTSDFASMAKPSEPNRNKSYQPNKPYITDKPITTSNW